MSNCCNCGIKFDDHDTIRMLHGDLYCEDCYTEETSAPNEDHSLDFDDCNSAYYMGGQASLEDYMYGQEDECYDPYDEEAW